MTDEKLDLIKYAINQGWPLPSDAVADLIVRLEAAEAVCKAVVDENRGDHVYSLAAWRVAKGEKK